MEQEWLGRYPRPYLITLDQGSEFIGQDFCDMFVNYYGIKRKIISTQNDPQANAIVQHASDAQKFNQEFQTPRYPVLRLR